MLVSASIAAATRASLLWSDLRYASIPPMIAPSFSSPSRASSVASVVSTYSLWIVVHASLFVVPSSTASSNSGVSR